MKLQFKDSDFRTDAVNAVADLFAGQENTRSTAGIGRDVSVGAGRWKRAAH